MDIQVRGCCWIPVATRTVNHVVSVNSDYVQEKSYIVSANKAITVHPRAKIQIELGWRSEDVIMAAQDDLMFDEMIGADYPDIWGLRKQQAYQEFVNLAQTCSQTADPQTPRPMYKEVNSIATDTLGGNDTKEEDDMESEVCWGDTNIDESDTRSTARENLILSAEVRREWTEPNFAAVN